MNKKNIYIINSINNLKKIKSYKGLNIHYIWAKDNKSILLAIKKAKKYGDLIILIPNILKPNKRIVNEIKNASVPIVYCSIDNTNIHDNKNEIIKNIKYVIHGFKLFTLEVIITSALKIIKIEGSKIILSMELKNNKAEDHAGLTAHGGYTFETNKGQMVTAVYLSFFNNSEEDVEIKSFSTDIAGRVEMHDVRVSDDIVKMFEVTNVKIKAKSELFLQPGGKHLMLFDLKKKLNDKETFPLNIKLKNKKILVTKIMVLNKKLKENFLN